MQIYTTIRLMMRWVYGEHKLRAMRMSSDYEFIDELKVNDRLYQTFEDGSVQEYTVSKIWESCSTLRMELEHSDSEHCKVVTEFDDTSIYKRL
jgi:hypothetical protein